MALLLSMGTQTPYASDMPLANTYIRDLFRRLNETISMWYRGNSRSSVQVAAPVIVLIITFIITHTEIS